MLRLAMAIRFDRGQLRAPRTLADGSIIVQAVISRAGVFEYRKDGRTWLEYRDPREVFDPASMSSFELMAVTNLHPDEGEVTIENRSELGKGSVMPGSVRRDGDLLIADLHITDATLIHYMKNGRREVSCGYFQDIIEEAGTSPKGERYDARQTNIRGNHVAIVDIARAGDVARVRMDGATMITGEPPATEKNMFKTIEEATAAYNAEKMRADQATSALESEKAKAVSEKKRADGFEAEAQTAKEKAEKAEKLRADGEKNAMANARARVMLEGQATSVLRTDGEPAPKFEGKSDREIRVAVIEKLSGKSVPSEKSDAYVEARYDSLIENEKEADKAIADVREGVRESGETRNDSSTTAAQKAHAEMVERNSNAWKTKKGA